MSIFNNLINQGKAEAYAVLDKFLVAENFTSFAGDVFGILEGVTAVTPTKIDDTALDEIEGVFEQSHFIEKVVARLRKGFGLDAEATPMMGATGIDASGKHHTLFMSFCRRNLAKMYRKEHGCTRKEAIAAIAGKSNAEIMKMASDNGIPVTELGDGTFMEKIAKFIKMIMAFLAKILPLFLVVQPKAK